MVAGGTLTGDPFNPQPMEQIVTNTANISGAFTEWERRFRENSEAFMNEQTRLQTMTPETYGEAVTPYFVAILAEKELVSDETETVDILFANGVADELSFSYSDAVEKGRSMREIVNAAIDSFKTESDALKAAYLAVPEGIEQPDRAELLSRYEDARKRLRDETLYFEQRFGRFAEPLADVSTSPIGDQVTTPPVASA